MDNYWGQNEVCANKKLDSEMDDYWKDKTSKPSSKSLQSTTAAAAAAETTTTIKTAGIEGTSF